MPNENIKGKTHNFKDTKSSTKSIGDKESSPTAATVVCGQKGYIPASARWDSVQKWYGSKVTVWLTPSRANALWHYAHKHKLPLLPTEVLYHLVESQGLGQSDWAPGSGAHKEEPRWEGFKEDTQQPWADAAHDAISAQLSDLRVHLQEQEASTNDALGAISTLLLQILQQLQEPEQNISQGLKEEGSEVGEQKVSGGEKSPTLLKHWLQEIKEKSNLALAHSTKEPLLIVASLELPQSVQVQSTSCGCQMKLLQVGAHKASSWHQTVLLPTLAVHSALKKAQFQSTLLIAKQEGTSWMVEIATLVDGGKQKVSLCTFEI